MMAVVGYILLGLLGAVVFLLCIPVAVRVRYRTDLPPEAELRWLFLRFDLLKEREKPVPAQTTGKKKKPKPAKPPAQRTPQEFSELLRLVTDLLASAKGAAGMLLRNFYIYRIRLAMLVVGEDAADTAISCGKVNTALYTVYAAASCFLRMARPETDIRPGFTAERGLVDFELGARLTPVVALAAGIRFGVAFVLRMFQHKKEQETNNRPPAATDKQAAGQEET